MTKAAKGFFIHYMKVRHIEKGINPSSVSKIYFSGENLAKGFRIGVVAGMVALTVSQLFNSSPLLQENWDLTNLL